jgi:hypothetical protein
MKLQTPNKVAADGLRFAPPLRPHDVERGKYEKTSSAFVVFGWLLPLRVFANDGVAAQGVGGVTIGRTGRDVVC